MALWNRSLHSLLSTLDCMRAWFSGSPTHSVYPNMMPCFHFVFLSAAARRALLTFSLGLLATAVWAAPKKDKAEVIANAELTEEGRQASRPTPGHPVYYVPVTHGAEVTL